MINNNCFPEQTDDLKEPIIIYYFANRSQRRIYKGNT